MSSPFGVAVSDRRAFSLVAFAPPRSYDHRMDPKDDERSERYRYLEPPIPLDQMIESVDTADHSDGKDDGYRDQEWLIRNTLG